MRRIIPAIVLFLAVLFTGSQASAVVDVEGRYWFTDLDGKVKVSSGSVSGTEIDFPRDLGVDESKGFPEGRITLELGSHKIRYAFVPLKWDGSNTISQTITFGGQTYSASSVVTSKLDLAYHRLGYEYDIIDTLNNRLGVVVELKYFDGEAKLQTTGVDESKTFRIPVPTIGVAGQVGLPFLFSVGGELTGITIGSKGYLYDAEAMVNLKPMPFVVVSGGYRIFKFHAENSGDLGDLTVKGPFVGLKADF